MDPDALLNDLLFAVAHETREEASERAQDMLNWLDMNGFTPGGGKLDRFAIQAFCNWVVREYSPQD
jgi:hypothetical protein